MEIHIRNIDRTCLEESAYLKLVKKYSSKLKHDVFISFDFRVKSYALYQFHPQRKVHLVKISPNTCGFTENGAKLDDGAEKYNLIASTIHELYHAQQYEELRQKFWNKRYSCASDISHRDSADFFSECEVDARRYENENLLPAIEYYNSCIEE